MSPATAPDALVSHPRPPGRWRRVAIAATRLATIGVVGAFVIPLVPVWPCALLEHFRVQYVVVGAVVVGGAGALQLRGWFDAAAVATLASFVLVVPGLSGEARAGPVDGVRIRLLLLNVHTANRQFAAVRTLIADTAPDVVALIEIDDRWVAELAPALAAYPARIEQPRADNFGIALYARGELRGGIEPLANLLPSIVADAIVAGARVAVIVTHPPPPVTSALLDAQVRQLDVVAARVGSLRRPVVVVGDLNATPWSRPFVRLIAATDLCDSRAGFGLGASFPAAPAILRIPIDHVLTSCDVGVRGRWIGRDVGSDHLPVVVDLVVPRAREL